MAAIMLARLAALFEPFILMLVGTVAFASLFPARGEWATIAHLAAQVGIVALFFLHGAKLSREAIVAGIRHWRLHLVVLTVTFGFFPLLGLGFRALPLLDPMLATGVLFLTLLPSTVQSSIAFTAIARGNVAAAVCSASFSNLIGIFATPALVTLTIGAGGEGGEGSLAAIETIVVQLLVPFIAGHLLRPVIGAFVARQKRLVSIVDRGSILLVVYTAFGAAVVEGLWHRVSAPDLALVLGVSIVLLVIVLVATWTIGGALGFAHEDRLVLLFCGSKKSLASGVPMAGVLFPAAQVGVILLPVMIFHQVQLIACALIARRFADAAPD
jgi:solute carrier family 10 (sodium/bile acid cotransporter), member 7